MFRMLAALTSVKIRFQSVDAVVAVRVFPEVLIGITAAEREVAYVDREANE
jgi:hypothetical protein